MIGQILSDERKPHPGGTSERGFHEISLLVDQLRIHPRDDTIDAALRLYKMAVVRGFLKGRRSNQVFIICFRNECFRFLGRCLLYLHYVQDRQTALFAHRLFGCAANQCVRSGMCFSRSLLSFQIGRASHYSESHRSESFYSSLCGSIEFWKQSIGCDTNGVEIDQKHESRLDSNGKEAFWNLCSFTFYCFSNAQ